MSNSLCPCSKLEWDASMYHLEHHPDCEVNKVSYSDTIKDMHPLAYWQLGDGNGTAMISGTIDHVIIHEKGVPPRRVDIALSHPPSQEQLMEMALKKLRELENAPEPNPYIILTCLEHGVFYRGGELGYHYPCPKCKKTA